MVLIIIVAHHLRLLFSRALQDITPDWSAILRLVDYSIKNNIFALARPGQWPLIDMMEVGNAPLSVAESRAHFSLWAMFAQPLHAGNDVRNMTEDILTILSNMEVIAVDRDVLGRAATLVTAARAPSSARSTLWALLPAPGYSAPPCAAQDLHCAPARDENASALTGFASVATACAGRADCGGLALYPDGHACAHPPRCRPPTPPALMPVEFYAQADGTLDADGDIYARLLADASMAVLLLNRGTAVLTMCVHWADIGLNGYEQAAVRDLWLHRDLGLFLGTYCATVPSHDVVMLRVWQ